MNISKTEFKNWTIKPFLVSPRRNTKDPFSLRVWFPEKHVVYLYLHFALLTVKQWSSRSSNLSILFWIASGIVLISIRMQILNSSTVLSLSTYNLLFQQPRKKKSRLGWKETCIGPSETRIQWILLDSRLPGRDSTYLPTKSTSFQVLVGRNDFALQWRREIESEGEDGAIFKLDSIKECSLPYFRRRQRETIAESRLVILKNSPIVMVYYWLEARIKTTFFIEESLKAFRIPLSWTNQGILRAPP